MTYIHNWFKLRKMKKKLKNIEKRFERKKSYNRRIEINNIIDLNQDISYNNKIYKLYNSRFKKK